MPRIHGRHVDRDKNKRKNQIDRYNWTPGSVPDKQPRNQNKQQTKTAAPSQAAKGPDSLKVKGDTCVVWFRIGHLRLRDNPAFFYASRKFKHVIPIFCWFPEEQGQWTYKDTVIEVWSRESLKDIENQLHSRYRNSLLVVANEIEGVDLTTVEAISNVMACYGAQSIYFNRGYEPSMIGEENQLKQACDQNGWVYEGFNAQLLKEPDEVPVAICMKELRCSIHAAFFTSWYKTEKPVRKPLPLPGRCPPPLDFVSQSVRQSYKHVGKMPLSKKTGKPLTWDDKVLKYYDVSEEGAWNALESFLEEKMQGYSNSRRRTDDKRQVSILSGYYRVGNLSVVEVYYKVLKHYRRTNKTEDDAHDKNSYLRRLVWRDYAYWQLFNYPHLCDENLRPNMQNLKWSKDYTTLQAWKDGKTGYPLVDAAMRELWETGYMQQNARMIVAQFLVEILGHHWIEGAKWFHFTLIDADLAINSMMWQNAGLTGVSQWGFEFHPILKARDVDPNGTYIEKWCPEVAKLPTHRRYSPWEVSPKVLKRQYGLVLGETYPHPIVTNIEAAKQLTACRFMEAKSRAPKYMCHGGYDVVPVPPNNGILSYQFVKVSTRGGWRRQFSGPVDLAAEKAQYMGEAGFHNSYKQSGRVGFTNAKVRAKYSTSLLNQKQDLKRKNRKREKRERSENKLMNRLMKECRV